MLSRHVIEFGRFSHTALLIGLALAVCLAATMALTSSYDAHPDEANHLSAALYYRYHFLPPAIGDPAVRDSYSVWGVSYLNYHWVEYFFAGKFVFLTQPVFADPMLAARFFNVFLLFAIMAALGWYASNTDPDIRTLTAFLLVSPQIWYVFSYSNNDAFALAVSMVLAYFLVAKDGLLWRYVSSPVWFSGLSGGLVFGLVVGSLAVCKPNYWAFLLFAAGWVILNTSLTIETLEKFAVMALVAFSVVAFRIGLDLYVNGETNFAGASYVSYFLGGFESTQSKLMKYQDEIAEYAFRPTTIETDLAHSRTEVKLRAKGVTAWEMLSKWRFHVFSFCSFVGLYGYMTIWGPAWYYVAMFLLFLAFGSYVSLMIVRSGDRRAIRSLVLFYVGAAISVGGSFYLSWNYAFQPQGRYLFPIIPMAAVTVNVNRRLLNKVPVNFFFAAAFVLSLYSFVFVGMRNLISP